MVKGKKVWCLTRADDALCDRLAQEFNITKTVSRLLVSRGYQSADEIRRFLFDNEAQLFDPYLLNDMEKVVMRLSHAKQMNEPVCIYGDYDVDGITAASLLLKVLRQSGLTAEVYIPDRKSEGYGLHSEALQRIYEQGYRLLITVDCGISAHQEVAATPADFDIVITDHHEPSETLPPAFAILNPKRRDSTYPEKILSGVGVVFKLCQALWPRLLPEREPSELFRYCDLVALGTVADIVPLTGENRILVKRGLQQIREAPSLGIQALLAVSQTKGDIDAGTIGFRLAPRLNAGGRMAHAAQGVVLLTSEIEAETTKIAAELDAENRYRQAVEKEILIEAEAIIAQWDIEQEKVLVVAGEGWHPGVIGIVASRLVERYWRPVIVISLQDGIGKGSCRSIPSFNMYEALQSLSSGTLIQFGGHHQAAGLTVLAEQISTLRTELQDYASKTLTPKDYEPILTLDVAVELAHIDEAFLGQLALLAPYGEGNRQPRFLCRNVKIEEIRAMGKAKDHLRLVISQEKVFKTVIAFGCGEWASMLSLGETVDLAFYPEYNEFNGKISIQLKAYDIKSAPKDELAALYCCDQGADKGWSGCIDADFFYTKIVGVTFENRQERIHSLQEGEALVLLREPTNPYDANAIQVQTEQKEVLGYLNAALAAVLAPFMSAISYEAQVASISGKDQKNWGVNIAVWSKRSGQSLPALTKLKPKDIDESIRQLLLGERHYRPSQQQTLDLLKQGRSCLTIMGTGRGKSAIFQSFAAQIAMRHNQMTIVLYPLRALVNDQFLLTQAKFSQLGLTVCRGTGALAAQEKAELLKALDDGLVDVLLATPEFVAAHLTLLQKQKDRIAFLVIDECHHMVLSGKKMRPVYQRIAELRNRLGKPLTLAVTATADNTVAKTVSQELELEAQVIDPAVRENLQLLDRRSFGDKLSYSKAIVGTGEKTLIYVNSRSQALNLANDLRRAFPLLEDQIGYYHGGISLLWRNKVEEWFRGEKLTTVVATSAFGEGIDIPDIRHVILYHAPFHLTAFNQQCGRVGRDGKLAEIHLLFGDKDISLNRLLLEAEAPSRNMVAWVYQALRRLADEKGALSSLNQEIAEYIEHFFGHKINDNAVGGSIRILEELSLLQREKKGRTRLLTLAPTPANKLDIGQSPYYSEGLREKELFEQFAAYIMTEPIETLLGRINQPIYPTDYKNDNKGVFVNEF